MTRSHSVVFLITALVGCAEVRDHRDTGLPGSDAPPVVDTGVPSSDVPSTVDAPRADAPTTGTGALVINELFSDGQDWVEFINTGTVGLSLEGLFIVDGDDTHVPVAFPAGATLPGGARFLVGFEHPCEDAPPAGLGVTERCITTDFGIGNGGDTIRVLDGEVIAEASVVVSLEYPGVAAAGLGAGQTYCRLPDGTGDFGACAPTPDATNAAP